MNNKHMEEQDPPRINKTNWTHIIWYFRDFIQYHEIHTVYIRIAYTSYHNPYTTCTQNVHSLNRSLQFINISAPGLLRWVPGQEQQGLHFIQKSRLRLLVKRWLILTKQITCNLHPPDFELCLQRRKFIGTVAGSKIRRLQSHLLKLVATVYIILYIPGG